MGRPKKPELRLFVSLIGESPNGHPRVRLRLSEEAVKGAPSKVAHFRVSPSAFFDNPFLQESFREVAEAAFLLARETEKSPRVRIRLDKATL